MGSRVRRPASRDRVRLAVRCSPRSCNRSIDRMSRPRSRLTRPMPATLDRAARATGVRFPVFGCPSSLRAVPLRGPSGTPARARRGLSTPHQPPWQVRPRRGPGGTDRVPQGSLRAASTRDARRSSEAGAPAWPRRCSMRGLQANQQSSTAHQGRVGQCTGTVGVNQRARPRVRPAARLAAGLSVARSPRRSDRRANPRPIVPLSEARDRLARPRTFVEPRSGATLAP
jgi:hypothetical protein